MTHVTINYRLFARFTRDAIRVLFFYGVLILSDSTLYRWKFSGR